MSCQRRDVQGCLLYPQDSHRDRCSVWSGKRSERTLVVHADNSRPHTAKVRRAFCDDNFLRIAGHSRHPPHPQYSPDLAPSGFFLFGHLSPQGQQFVSADELLSGVRKNPDEISVDTLETVFRYQINRLYQSIATLQQMKSTSKVHGNEGNNSLLSYS
jgi:hypothetical protein